MAARPGGADDAHGHGLGQAKGIAHGQNHVAHLNFGTVRQRDGGKVMRVNLHHRHIGCLVLADNFGGEFAAILQGHFHLVGIVHHMVIGQDIAVLGHDHAGTQAVFGRGENPLLSAAERGAKELAEEGIIQ